MITPEQNQRATDLLNMTREEREQDYRDRIENTVYLAGHISPETAFVVPDYPYGFRLRCQIRYWLEHKPKFGFRLVSQTSNPKKPGLVWNKPKPGTYHEFAVMVLNEEGQVQLHTASPGGWTEEATLRALEQHYAGALTEEHRKALRYIRATIKANEVITVTVGGDGPRQTEEERNQVIRSALSYGYAQVVKEEGSTREPLAGEALARELQDIDPEDLEAADDLLRQHGV